MSFRKHSPLFSEQINGLNGYERLLAKKTTLGFQTGKGLNHNNLERSEKCRFVWCIVASFLTMPTCSCEKFCSVSFHVFFATESNDEAEEVLIESLAPHYDLTTIRGCWSQLIAQLRLIEEKKAHLSRSRSAIRDPIDPQDPCDLFHAWKRYQDFATQNIPSASK